PGVSRVVLLPDPFGLDPSTNDKEASQFEFPDWTGIAVAELLVKLHDPPFIQDQRVNSRHRDVGGVVAMPAVLAEGLIDLDDFFAVFPPRSPEGHVRQDRHVEPEL